MGQILEKSNCMFSMKPMNAGLNRTIRKHITDEPIICIVFLYVPRVQMQELRMLDLNIDFYAKVYPYSQVLRSRIARVGQNMRNNVVNMFFLVIRSWG